MCLTNDDDEADVIMMMMVMMMIFLIMCLADVQRLRGLAGSHHKAQVHDQVSFIPGHHHYVYDDDVDDDCIDGGDDCGNINHMYITIIIVFLVTNDLYWI